MGAFLADWVAELAGRSEQGDVEAIRALVLCKAPWRILQPLRVQRLRLNPRSDQKTEARSQEKKERQHVDVGISIIVVS